MRNKDRIEEYYQKIWKLILKNNIEEAKKLLYSMNKKLYDESLNILFERKHVDTKLYKLILKVDNKLSNNIIEDEDIEEGLQNDIFQHY